MEGRHEVLPALRIFHGLLAMGSLELGPEYDHYQFIRTTWEDVRWTNANCYRDKGTSTEGNLFSITRTSRGQPRCLSQRKLIKFVVCLYVVSQNEPTIHVEVEQHQHIEVT